MDWVCFMLCRCRWYLLRKRLERTCFNLGFTMSKTLTKETQSKNFPMISTSIFTDEGNRWNQTFVFGPTFQLNQTALDIEGLPRLTGMRATCASIKVYRRHSHTLVIGSYVWANMTASWAVSDITLALCRYQTVVSHNDHIPLHRSGA